MPQFPEVPANDVGSLERARARLYQADAVQDSRAPFTVAGRNSVPHEWGEELIMRTRASGKRHLHFAIMFFMIAVLFFLISLATASYFFFYGGNAVSVDKVSIEILGPATIAGGDTVPLSLTVTNKNSTALENATIEITFPNGTRSTADVLSPYPRYTENLGTIASGAVITRSVKAVVFGGAGEALALPVSFSFSAAGSNSIFVKKVSYQLAVSSTPLSVSVDTPAEVTSGNPFAFAITVRSNATVPLDNVVLSGAFPFGFSVVSSSPVLSNSAFLLGTMRPGASKTLTLTGTIEGQDAEQRVFHFTVGTAKTAQDQTLAVTYMTQDATVKIAPHFIDTTLALNGNTAANVVIAPGSYQNATVSYTNMLTTSMQDSVISIAISGSAIDYGSIKTTNGFYNSADHTIIFSRDTDPALATLAPHASGLGTFTFSTRASGALPPSPTITFTISVSGTRIGETNTTEQMNTSATKTAKVATTIALSASSLHSSGPFSNSGFIPPRADQATTYAIVWNAQNQGSAVAGGTVSSMLPSYVSYTGETSGAGSFSYNKTSRTVTWNIGDLAQGGYSQGAFQISLVPSTSQNGNAPALTGAASFSGYDRFAGVTVSATADPPTTETVGDPGYVGANAIVQ